MSEFYRIIRLSSPVAEPVTLAEAKAQLQVDFSDDDEFITSLIAVARDKCEQYCNRLLADATAAILYDGFPSGKIPLHVPFIDVTAVDAVAYIDEDNASQTVTGTTYNADFQYLWPLSTWPTVLTQGVRVAVTIEPTVQPGIKQALLMFITELYEYRADLTERQVYDNKAAMILLQPYRVEMGL